MRGTAEAQGLLWDSDVLCADLLDDEGFLASLGRARGSVFCDADFDALYPSRRGRPSHPPSVMAALLLAQLFYGVSDREAERRSRLDLSWKAALGLRLDHRGIPHACLAEFRARLLRAGLEARLHEILLGVATDAGVVGGRRAVDSTGIADSVLTQDTVTLIRSAVRRCLAQLGVVDVAAAAALRVALRRDDYDLSGKPHIIWDDPDARRELLGELFADTAATLAVCRHVDDPDLDAAAALLARVAGQDLEIGDNHHDDDTGPRVRIRRAVAADRVISTVDPDARHGHRSRRDRYDGYKLHLSVDLDSDLLTAVEASRATVADAEVLHGLLDADPGDVAEVIADTAYGSGDTRVAMADREVTLVAPAQPPGHKKGRFTIADFDIDVARDRASCPAGHRVTPTRRRRPADADRIQFRFPAEVCAACPLRSSCTDSAGGRTLTVGPHTAFLQQVREQRWTPQFRDRYRQRAQVERKAAQVKFRSPRIPWRGLPKAKAWIKLRAAALNLDRLGRLGLLPA